MQLIVSILSPAKSLASRHPQHSCNTRYTLRNTPNTSIHISPSDAYACNPSICTSLFEKYDLPPLAPLPHLICPPALLFVPLISQELFFASSHHPFHTFAGRIAHLISCTHSFSLPSPSRSSSPRMSWPHTTNYSSTPPSSPLRPSPHTRPSYHT
jgi:hypothetical protein